MRFGHAEPSDADMFEAIRDMTHELTGYGVFNYLLSNGRVLLAHCSTTLYYVIRAWPFRIAHLIDTDMSVDFSQTNAQGDCVTVIATKPLTDNEGWIAFETGELIMFDGGQPSDRALIPIPHASQQRNRENLACV